MLLIVKNVMRRVWNLLLNSLRRAEKCVWNCLRYVRNVLKLFENVLKLCLKLFETCVKRVKCFESY